MKIAIHGGTGAQGGAVAKELESRGHTALRLCRTASKVGVQADLNDPSSLARAYRGADAVFVHLPIPHDPAQPGAWAKNVIQALGEAGISRVVYSTSGTSLTAGDAGPHPILQASEAGVRALYQGLSSVVSEVVAIAPRLFLDNLLLPFVSRPLTQDGVLAYPLAADKPVSWTSHADVARAAAAAFEGGMAPGVYDIGLFAMTGPELASALAEGLGRLVTYEAISPDEFARRAEPLFGAEAAGGVGALYEAYASDPSRALPADAILVAGEHRSAARWASDALTTERST